MYVKIRTADEGCLLWESPKIHLEGCTEEYRREHQGVIQWGGVSIAAISRPLTVVGFLIPFNRRAGA